jgi:hypothetical protein
MPPIQQAVVLVRVLSYDANLKRRAGTDIVVGVVAKPGNAASQSAASAMVRAFRGLERVKVLGLPLKATQLLYSTPAALSNAIESQGIDALYLCAGLDGDLGGILGVTRNRKVITMASAEEQLHKGASVGVFVIDEQPTIVVNLASAKSEGAALGSDVLRLAKVIR